MGKFGRNLGAKSFSIFSKTTQIRAFFSRNVGRAFPVESRKRCKQASYADPSKLRSRVVVKIGSPRGFRCWIRSLNTSCIAPGGRRFKSTLRTEAAGRDRKSTRLNSSHGYISYAVFCLKKKNKTNHITRGTESAL